MYYKIKELLREAKDRENVILVTLCDTEDLARDLCHYVEDLERAFEAAEVAKDESAVSGKLVDLLGTALDVAYKNSDYAFDKCDELREELAHWTTIRQHLEAAFEECGKEALENWE